MSILSKLRNHKVAAILIGLVVIIIAIIAGRNAGNKTPAANTSDVKQVTVVNVGSFQQDKLSVSANGVVESRSQAELRSQSSAPVAVINVAIGETVYPGEVILELQNADTRAQLMQAEASLALAKGQYSTGAVSLSSAKQSAIDKIHDAYTKTYDAIFIQAEPILNNNDGRNGQLTSYSTNATLNSEILDAYLTLKYNINQWKTLSDSLTDATTTEAVQYVINLSQKNMSTADVVLGGMTKIFSNLSSWASPEFQATINTWKGSIAGAQSSLSGSLQALTAAETALNTSSTSQGSSANAQVAVAEAGVNNLQAQLAKTIIRSPIAGRVSVLPLRVGELASPGTLVATVIGNDSSLIIKAFVSGEDLSKVSIGEPVTIQGRKQANASSTDVIKGVISNIAPGVDPTTKKAEVDIDVINSESSGLVIGNNITVSIAQAVNSNQVQPPAPKVGMYLLPIQDVKIIPGAAYVFTVEANSKVKRNDVILGSIQGDFIQVVGGLTDDMNIVSPVYELDEGQQVRVQ